LSDEPPCVRIGTLKPIFLDKTGRLDVGNKE